MSVFLGALWVIFAIYCLWQIVFGGGQSLVISDTGTFGLQELKIDSTVIGGVLLSGLIFFRAAISNEAKSSELLSLGLSAMGLLVCSATYQFWYFSLGILFFILSLFISGEQSNARGLVSLVFVSALGVALEPYYLTSPQWFLAIYFSLYYIVAFRTFPHAIKKTDNQPEASTITVWLLYEAPAVAAAIFFIRRAPLYLHEQEILFLKIGLTFFSLLTLLKSFSLNGRLRRAQVFCCTVGLLLVYSLGSASANEWVPPVIISLVALITGAQLGRGEYLKTRWIFLFVILILCSPLSYFGHGVITTIGSEEFLKNFGVGVIPLVLFGLSLGELLALTLLTEEDRSTHGVRVGLSLLLFVMVFLFFWKNVWIKDTDLVAITDGGAWVPLSIVYTMGVVALLAHRVITKSFSSFGKKISLQDDLWRVVVSGVSEKSQNLVVLYERQVIQNSLGKILQKGIDTGANSIVKAETVLFHSTTGFSKKAVDRVSGWIIRTQTKDPQYYLIFGIGTVVLVLLHFFINATL